MTERKFSEAMAKRIEDVRLSLDALRAIGRAPAPEPVSLAEAVEFYRSHPPTFSPALQSALGITGKDNAA